MPGRVPGRMPGRMPGPTRLVGHPDAGISLRHEKLLRVVLSSFFLGGTYILV